METAPGHDNMVAKPASQLPLQIVAALDAADPAGLRSLLTTLACALELPSTAGAQLQARPFHAVVKLDSPRPSVAETARATPPRQTVARPLFGPIAAHVLLPMTVVTSALVVLMAWIR